MITDVRIIYEVTDHQKKHYRLAVETYNNDLFGNSEIHEILPNAPHGQAENARRAIIKAYKSVGIKVLK